jgi:hypothetical protein
MPYFLGSATTVADARIEILRTLATYAARTRPNFLLAAQVIALGMTTLDALHEARTLEMSEQMRLRYRANANSLNRAMLQTEKSLQANLAVDIAPEPVQPAPAEDPAPDAETAAAVIQHSAADPVAPNPETTAAAVIDALRMMGLAPPSRSIPSSAVPSNAAPPGRSGARSAG